MELTDVKGIGGATANKLSTLGISTPTDLINFLPKSYVDLKVPLALADAEEGQFVLLRIKILSVGREVKTRAVSFFKASGECETPPSGRNVWKSAVKKLSMIWFNQPYLRGSLVVGNSYFVLGKLKYEDGRRELVNPVFEAVEGAKKLTGIMSVYRTKGQVYQSSIKKYVLDVLQKTDIPSLLSEDILRRYDLDDVRTAYLKAHSPDSVAEGLTAQRRIALEDTVNLIISYKILVKNNKVCRKIKYTAPNSCVNEFLDNLDFSLTSSQNSALKELLSDLSSGYCMNRLLCGDVGSGKTVVAFAAMYYAVRSGYQAAMMAPTEILAQQHYRNALHFFNNQSLKIEYLSASVSAAERRRILDGVASGEVDILIGTHSLIQKDVTFKKLSLTVVDEQHKFGVVQKSALEDLSLTSDTLTLSATPIPRALALILYEDLRMSTIYKREGSTAVKTALVPDDKLDGLFSFIKEEAERGNQSFIVCPRVFDSEGIDIYSAESLYKQLKDGEFKDLRLGLLHGKQSFTVKSKVMQDFAAGKLDVLVATTVVEVGIDVQNATVMAVLNADRFGLATLHQLRGRVGRGEKSGYCFLHTAKQEENERLQVLKTESDGYVIAEKDFDMRGGGDFLGTRQCGDTFDSRYAVRLDVETIKAAKRIAEDVMDREDYLDELSAMDLDKYYAALSSVTEN